MPHTPTIDTASIESALRDRPTKSVAKMCSCALKTMES